MKTISICERAEMYQEPRAVYDAATWAEENAVAACEYVLQHYGRLPNTELEQLVAEQAFDEGRTRFAFPEDTRTNDEILDTRGIAEINALFGFDHEDLPVTRYIDKYGDLQESYHQALPSQVHARVADKRLAGHYWLPRTVNRKLSDGLRWEIAYQRRAAWVHHAAA